MKISWYIGGLIGIFSWMALTYLIALWFGGPHAFFEMVGTFLTLLPVGIDFLRKYYVRRLPPGANRAAIWLAFGHFDIILAIIFALGSTLVGLGFAVEYTHPKHQ